MKLKPVKLAPALIVLSVILLVSLLRLLQPDFLERPELMTYDMRVREALKFPAPAATNLGFVFRDDDSITALNNGSLGFRYGFDWPRHIYGRMYRELAAQGAKAVAFDILFSEARPNHGTVPVASTNVEVSEFLAALHPGQPPITYEDQNEKFTLLESDEFFAWQLKRGGTAIVAAERNVPPLDLFATNALKVADIAADRDADGVLRRARAFSIYRKWDPEFRKQAAEDSVDLNNVRIEPGRIIFLRPQATDIVVKIDAETNFDFTGSWGTNLPAGVAPKVKAFTDERVWHMGIELAARELHLDLSKAEVDLTHGRIVLRGENGVERIIPVDEDGYFFINWELTSTDKRLTMDAVQSLLAQDQIRNGLGPGQLKDRWAGKLVVIGSSATGNNLADRGATPLEKDTFLVTKHWNVANSVITGRFILRSSLAMDLLLIAALGIAAGLITWQLRALLAFLFVTLLAVGYLAFGNFLYVHYRFWLPLVLPVFGAMLMTHICLVTWRVVFEQAERRRVKSIFSTVVSPKIMDELLNAERLSLGGARREVTVLFADVRGFTEFTDKKQEQAAAFVEANKLTGETKEAYFDEQARETLATVNLYLGLIADTIVKHDATLDKFIGDCVMAFWGAPTPNPKHATDCVRAAIESQRAIYELNRQRAELNKKIELENAARTSAGLVPKPILAILLLGTGINTGVVTVGLMGSETKAGVRQGNYTVFGREVNLASRLESVSGRGRIVISEATYEHLQRDNPALAATCVALAAEKVKGISTAVKIYEVPWRPSGSISLDEEFFSKKLAVKASETEMIREKKT